MHFGFLTVFNFHIISYGLSAFLVEHLLRQNDIEIKNYCKGPNRLENCVSFYSIVECLFHSLHMFGTFFYFIFIFDNSSLRLVQTTLKNAKHSSKFVVKSTTE